MLLEFLARHSPAAPAIGAHLKPRRILGRHEHDVEQLVIVRQALGGGAQGADAQDDIRPDASVEGGHMRDEDTLGLPTSRYSMPPHAAAAEHATASR